MELKIEEVFNKTYAYQEQVKDEPMIKAWLARVKAAVAAMNGVEVEFATNLQERCAENAVYHDHDNQLVAEFLEPLISSLEGPDFIDEECLPYYRVRFEDGAIVLADDAELFSFDRRFIELVSAVSGAFEIAGEMGFVGPWHLAAEGTEAQKETFLVEFDGQELIAPLSHWALNHNTPARFRQSLSDSDYHKD